MKDDRTDPLRVVEDMHTIKIQKEELMFLESLRDQCLSSIGYRVWTDTFALQEAIETFNKLQDRIRDYYKNH